VIKRLDHAASAVAAQEAPPPSAPAAGEPGAATAD
jgi:hypothetical protein